MKIASDDFHRLCAPRREIKHTFVGEVGVQGERVARQAIASMPVLSIAHITAVIDMRVDITLFVEVDGIDVISKYGDTVNADRDGMEVNFIR